MNNKTIRYILIAIFAIFAVAIIWTIIVIARKDDKKETASEKTNTNETTLVAQPVTDSVASAESTPKTTAPSTASVSPEPVTKTVTSYYYETVTSSSSSSASSGGSSASASASASAQ